MENSAGTIVLAVVWALCNAVLVLVGFAVAYLQAGSVAACGTSHPCDIPLASSIVVGLSIAAAVILSTTLVGAIVLARRGWSILWAPAAGTIISIAVIAASIGLLDVATS